VRHERQLLAVTEETDDFNFNFQIANLAPGRLGLFNDFCAPAPDRDVLRRAHHIG